jgi:hypothetical protein
MDTEEPSVPGTEHDWRVDPAASLPPGTAPKPSRSGVNLGRIAIGLLVAFVVGSLLYGPNMTLMAAGLLVICTVGFGLIPLLLGAWVIGWIVLAVWDAIQEARGPEGPSIAPGASGG